MGPKGLKRLCHGCLVNFVFYAHGASMAKSQIGVNRCLQTFKHGLRKSVRPSSFQKAQLQSVSIFFKFVDCLAPFAFAVLFSYYEQLFSCCTQFCDGSLCLRVSMGWWLLRLSAKILALLRLSVNFL